MSLGERIREGREAFHPKLTQHELARLAGIPRSNLAQYEVDRSVPPIKVLKQIATALGVSEARLVAEPSGKVKIYGAVSAGDGNTASIDASEFDVPIQFARDDYGGLIVEGDSMLPFLHSSDVAIFRDWTQPKVGHIMAAQVEDGGWVAKVLVYEGGRYILRSLNPTYPDVVSNYRLAGFLVGLIRDDGPERLIRLNPYGLKP